MTVIIRKPKFDTIKTRSRTARTRSKGGGQWGMRVMRAHVRRREHPNYKSRSISNNPIKWGTRGKSEKTFKPDGYRSSGNYLRKKHEKARAYQINASHSKLIVHEPRRLNTRIKQFLIKAFIPWTPNPGLNITAILTLGGFLLASISVLLNQVGYGPVDPNAIELGKVAFYTGLGRASPKLDS